MRRVRPAFALVHMLAVLPIAALLLMLLGRLIIDAIYVQRLAAEHLEFVTLQDDLLTALRRDACAATGYVEDGDSLVLRTAGPRGPEIVTYTVEPQSARRTRPGETERIWQSRRLRFGWHIERGPRGHVLWLTLEQTPPARRTAVLPHSLTATVLLPAAGERLPAAAGVRP
ncbi:MAG: hypothetical protein AB1716_11090 [Planctomycetota bacterium]